MIKNQVSKLLLTALTALYLSSPIQAKETSANHYQPDEYTDVGRLQRVKRTRDKVHSLFQKFVEDKQVPGLAYAVILDDEIAYSGAFGVTDVNSQSPVSNQSLFRIASISKPFTAMAILQLRDAGKLNLDDPVSKYLKYFNDLAMPTTDSPEITIRHLLTHSAGLPEDNAWGDRLLAKPENFIPELVGKGISFSNVPGQKYEYSNLGYALLGQIIEEVSGISFEQYTTTNILKPLGMNSSVWEYSKAQQKHLVSGYEWRDDSFNTIPLEHHGAFGPMAGLITSIEDFTKFATQHLSAWPARSEQDHGILKRSSIRDMHFPHNLYYFSAKGKCPLILAYGYGLNWAKECDGNPYVSHNGGLPGFGSNWLFSPELGVSIVSFNNKTYASTLWVNRSVFKEIIKSAELQPRTQKTPKLLEQTKAKFARLMFDWEKARESNLFAENFFQDNHLEDLKAEAAKFEHEIGAITRVGAIQPSNQLRGKFIVYGETKNLEVFFSLTPESQPLIQKVKFKLLEQ